MGQKVVETPQWDEIWTELAFGQEVGIVQINGTPGHSFSVFTYPDGMLRRVNRSELGRRVTCEMEILAWASRSA